MSIRFLSRLLVSAALATASPAALAEAQLIVIGDDGDPFAAAASAPDGAIIEIQSDQTFVGTLMWGGKGLTVRAGAGYAPTIQSPGFGLAVWLLPGQGDASATLEGLVILGSLLQPWTVWVETSGGTPETHRLVVTDCRVTGEVRGYAKAGGHVQIDVVRSELDENVVADTRGLYLESVGGGTIAVDAQDAELAAYLAGSGSGQIDLSARRCLVLGGVAVLPSHPAADVFLESCILQPSFCGTFGCDTSLGLASLSGAPVTGRVVNCTVTGFTTGIPLCDPGVTFENLLVYDNAADVDPLLPAAQIANSLIEDGTHAGVNGNFQATPLIDPFQALAATSPGVDAGNDAALGLGSLDYNGDPRIQDVDGDLVPRVNVGAVESPSCAPALGGSQAVRLGSPPNPSVLFPAAAPPALGETWLPTLDTGFAAGGVSILGVTTAPTNLVLPGFGTLLCDPTGPTWTFGFGVFGTFPVPMPAACPFVGISLCAQAATIQGSTVQLTNALDVTIGLF